MHERTTCESFFLNVGGAATVVCVEERLASRSLFFIFCARAVEAPSEVAKK